ncbi:MAG: RluA family pseudouridine synthase [bacterium]
MSTLPTILFEDEWLIAFDKPSGVLVAPDRWDSTLDNLMQLIRDRIAPTCFNVHGLDRDASGIVLCAKTKEMKKTAGGLFETGRALREFTAITRGAPPSGDEGIINLPIGPDVRNPGRMRVSPDHGTPAETRYNVIERWTGFSLLRVISVTNRSHQARVHLAAIQTPIIGDQMYGDGIGLSLSEIKPHYKQKGTPEKPLISRLALHAGKTSLDHPVTGLPLVIEAPLPEKMEIAIKYLRRFA